MYVTYEELCRSDRLGERRISKYQMKFYIIYNQIENVFYYFLFLIESWILFCVIWCEINICMWRVPWSPPPYPSSGSWLVSDFLPETFQSIASLLIAWTSSSAWSSFHFLFFARPFVLVFILVLVTSSSFSYNLNLCFLTIPVVCVNW